MVLNHFFLLKMRYFTRDSLLLLWSLVEIASQSSDFKVYYYFYFWVFDPRCDQLCLSLFTNRMMKGLEITMCSNSHSCFFLLLYGLSKGFPNYYGCWRFYALNSRTVLGIYYWTVLIPETSTSAWYDSLNFSCSSYSAWKVHFYSIFTSAQNLGLDKLCWETATYYALILP